MAVTATSRCGQPSVCGSTEPMRMFLLTFALIGLQFCWGTEMVYGTPYLLSLGMPKSSLSWVWVAGPLSGLVMQPIVGNLSDRSTSKYGRRRPFMVVGTAMVVTCMLVLAWAAEIVAFFVKDVGMRQSLAIALAVLDIYVLDFVINIAQSCCRSIIVDTLPTEKQQQGSAWASRMTGVGHLALQGVGSLDLNYLLGSTFGATQFKKMCAISAAVMVVAVGVTCYSVREVVFVADRAECTKKSLLPDFREIFTATRNLPPRMQAICWIQFWSWIGWFPFMFYSSTWIGEIYLRHGLPPGTRRSKDVVSEVGRVGSHTLMINGLISFAGSILLPLVIQSPEDEVKPSFTPRPPRSLEPVLNNIKTRKPTLLAAWTAGTLGFALTMMWAPWVKSVGFAALLVALTGLPGAINSWAPFAFMGVEINNLGYSLPTTQPREKSVEFESADSKLAHLRQDEPTSAATGSGELAGLYLAILNFYTAGPQFIGSGISIVVFSLLEPGKSPELAKEARPEEHHGTDGPSAIGVCLFIGAVCAVVAAWKTRDLRRLQATT